MPARRSETFAQPLKIHTLYRFQPKVYSPEVWRAKFDNLKKPFAGTAITEGDLNRGVLLFDLSASGDFKSSYFLYAFGDDAERHLVRFFNSHRRKRTA